jgi:hypothetical protein
MTVRGFLTDTISFHFQASLFLICKHHLEPKISAKNGSSYESFPVIVVLSRQYFCTLLIEICRCAAKARINSSCPGDDRQFN